MRLRPRAASAPSLPIWLRPALAALSGSLLETAKAHASPAGLHGESPNADADDDGDDGGDDDDDDGDDDDAGDGDDGDDVFFILIRMVFSSKIQECLKIAEDDARPKPIWISI